ncbi:hypothetical protein AB1Y20_003590 [Prymnesium parvum]|uniref:ABM domain-containing protein n=1 Tax=Prymnesium parvum TaxID=97485 RepID=A0AB34J6Z7_PRYPA|mmetsp:Transcript_30652/g.76540  ORF Transcript_30652/g.76540 Transcript_30652/m.76540 type:complete len:143 (-) Transcript_30652:23-451(-)
MATGGMMGVLLCTLAIAQGLRGASVTRRATTRLRGGELSMSAVAVIVDVTIKPEARDEFLKVMEIDAVGSRKEEGCLRFDVLCDQTDPNRFFFYEVYKNADAIATHKEQPHFKAWSDFKAGGGVVSSVSAKTEFPFDAAYSG